MLILVGLSSHEARRTTTNTPRRRTCKPRIVEACKRRLHWGNQGAGWNKENHTWAAWTDYESPVIFICQNHPDDMGYGGDEKEAILQYCEKAGIDKPDWWK